MKTVIKLLTGVMLLALPIAGTVSAQSVTALKQDLRKQESAAGSDTEKLLELASWAKDKGLINDRRRLLQKIIKIDKDHVAAHEMLGFVKFDGKWLTKSKAELLARRALEAEMKKKGLVDVDGVWVTKGEVKDAKKGIFVHDGERVSRAEKLALSAGKVRHPRTGNFIPAAELAKAEAGQFRTAEGTWVSEADANAYHGNENRPWVVRSTYVTIVSTMPIEKIEELGAATDSGFESIQPLFGGVNPSPLHRPTIVVASDADQFRKLGNDIGDEGSAYGVFQAINPVEISGLGSAVPVVMNNDPNWGPYYARHAAGLAYVNGICADLEAEVPTWFRRAVGGYCERHFNAGVAGHFGKQHLAKGGVKELPEWFEKFEISANLESRQLDYNVFQAGLVLGFAMSGKDEDTTEAIQGVTEACAKGGEDLAKAIAKFEKVVRGKEDELREYLRLITR